MKTLILILAALDLVLVMSMLLLDFYFFWYMTMENHRKLSRSLEIAVISVSSALLYLSVIYFIN